MFNAIAILLISLAIFDAIFFSWLFYKIRQEERKQGKSGCGCAKCQAAAKTNGTATPCAKCQEQAAKLGATATPCAKCREAAAKNGTTATPCAKCQAAAAKRAQSGQSGCGCNKRSN